MYKGKFAVVDLETTGNNKDRDAVIQLSIVFIDQMTITSQFTTFLSDETELSPFIRELTSIEPEMLEGAPKFETVAGELFDMLNGYTFVAHNVDFDLRFLQSHFEKVNMSYQPLNIIDTVELSKIFLPSLIRYQLSEITDALGVELTNAHRADADALATAHIFLHIIEKMTETNSETLKKLYHLSKHLKYDLQALLFSVLADIQCPPGSELEQYSGFYFKKEAVEQVNLEPVSVDELYKKYIDLSDETYREDQLILSREIFSRFENKTHLAIEAYTGLGKTTAFLIAAVSYHSMYQKKILISTSRKILQNQMMTDAFLKLKKVLDLPVTAVNFKGRDNYIDLEAFNALLNSDDRNHEINILKMRLLIWLLETSTGDLSEIELRGPENAYYRTARIQSGQPSKHIFFERALNQSNMSHLIFTNHYFLQDCLNVLDHLDVLVVDEAHQLKNAVSERFKRVFTYQDMKFFVGQIGSPDQDRLLSGYIADNQTASEYLLVDLIDKLNQNVDFLFSRLQAGNIKKAVKVLDEGIQFTSIFLSTIRSTNNYQALYNHVHFYRESLEELKDGLLNDIYQIKGGHNFQLVKVILTQSDMETIHNHLGQLSSIILISGTLEVRESFKHLDFWFKDLPYDTKVMSLDSLHDRTKLFIPSDIPEYNTEDEEYFYALIEYISIYLYETGGRLMVLFSNYDLLQKIYDFTKEVGLFNDFAVLKQTKSTSAHKLLVQYNQLDRALLLATTSFSEGINIEGSGDKCVMLPKLPFPVPSDNHFKSFHKNDLPEAVFRFRQVIGRVRRHPDDKGLILLMDNRILSKSYKNAFLKYFPSENVIEGDRKTFKAFLSHL